MAFLPLAALAVGAIGAGISAYGTVEQGQATSNAAKYNAQVAQNNATIAARNANYATQAGEEKAFTTSLQGAETLGSIKTAQAAGGVDVNTGSNLAVQKSEREVSNLDTQTVLNNAQLVAYGYRSQQTGFKAQAGLEQLAAAQAPVGTDIGAAGGLLGSASGLSFKWSQVSPTATV